MMYDCSNDEEWYSSPHNPNSPGWGPPSSGFEGVYYGVGDDSGSGDSSGDGSHHNGYPTGGGAAPPSPADQLGYGVAVSDPMASPEAYRLNLARSFCNTLSESQISWGLSYNKEFHTLVDDYVEMQWNAPNPRGIHKTLFKWIIDQVSDPNSNITMENYKEWFCSPYSDDNEKVELLADWKLPNIVRPTAAFKNNKKLNKIYNDIKTKGLFKFYLQKFEPKFSVAHLLFDVGTPKKTDVAETVAPENYWIKIVFDKRQDWNNMPNLVITHIFMHEMIHAEIYRKLLSISKNDKGGIDWVNLNKNLNERNFPGLFDYYVKYIRGNDTSQHEVMAKHYVGAMTAFLKKVYGNKYTDDEYRAVAWIGLKNTVAWKSLKKDDRNKYENLYNENYWQWEK